MGNKQKIFARGRIYYNGEEYTESYICKNRQFNNLRDLKRYVKTRGGDKVFIKSYYSNEEIREVEL